MIIAPRAYSAEAGALAAKAGRQAREERPILISPDLGALCAFARVTVFPMSLIRNSVEKLQICLASV